MMVVNNQMERGDPASYAKVVLMTRFVHIGFVTGLGTGK